MPNDFKQIKQKCDRLRAQRERAQGALDQIQKRLKDEFGVTLEGAPKKLKELQAAAKKTKTRYDKALDEFMAAWGDKLGGQDGEL